MDYDVEVGCVECDHRFTAKNTEVDVELDEGYSEDDVWWIHIYRTECPQCKEVKMVDVFSDNVPCCLD